MASDITLNSQNQIISLVNTDNELEQTFPLNDSLVTIDEVASLVDDPEGRNTSAIVKAIPNSGVRGQVPIKYNRMDIDNLSNRTLYFSKLNINAEELVTGINTANNCNLELEDIVPPSSIPEVTSEGSNLNVSINPDSKAWTGDIDFNLFRESQLFKQEFATMPFPAYVKQHYNLSANISVILNKTDENGDVVDPGYIWVYNSSTKVFNRIACSISNENVINQSLYINGYVLGGYNKTTQQKISDFSLVNISNGDITEWTTCPIAEDDWIMQQIYADPSTNGVICHSNNAQSTLFYNFNSASWSMTTVPYLGKIRSTISRSPSLDNYYVNEEGQLVKREHNAVNNITVYTAKCPSNGQMGCLLVGSSYALWFNEEGVFRYDLENDLWIVLDTFFTSNVTCSTTSGSLLKFGNNTDEPITDKIWLLTTKEVNISQTTHVANYPIVSNGPIEFIKFTSNSNTYSILRQGSSTFSVYRANLSLPTISWVLQSTISLSESIAGIFYDVSSTTPIVYMITHVPSSFSFKRIDLQTGAIINLAGNALLDTGQGVVVGNSVYIQAGVSSFIRYNITNNTWTTLASPPARASYVGGTNKALFDNGEIIFPTMDGRIMKYTISSNSWAIIGRALTPVANAQRMVKLSERYILYTHQLDLFLFDKETLMYENIGVLDIVSTGMTNIDNKIFYTNHSFSPSPATRILSFTIDIN